MKTKHTSVYLAKNTKKYTTLSLSFFLISILFFFGGIAIKYWTKWQDINLSINSWNTTIEAKFDIIANFGFLIGLPFFFLLMIIAFIIREHFSKLIIERIDAENDENQVKDQLEYQQKPHKLFTNWLIFLLFLLVFSLIGIVAIKYVNDWTPIQTSFTSLWKSFDNWGTSTNANTDIVANTYILIALPILVVVILITLLVQTIRISKQEKDNVSTSSEVKTLPQKNESTQVLEPIVQEQGWVEEDDIQTEKAIIETATPIVEPKAFIETPTPIVEPKPFIETPSPIVIPEIVQDENIFLASNEQMLKIRRKVKKRHQKRKSDILIMVIEDTKDLELPKVAIKRVVDQIFDFISETLLENDEAAINGFAKFKTAEKAEKESFNPLTGERITVEASTTAKMKISKPLKDAMNNFIPLNTPIIKKEMIIPASKFNLNTDEVIEYLPFEKPISQEEPVEEPASEELEKEALSYLDSLESKYEDAPIEQLTEEEKITLSTKERSQRDGSNLIAEPRHELQKYSNVMRQSLRDKGSRIKDVNLRDMTKKELIAYMKKAKTSLTKKTTK